jgi:hypothetical protein
MMMMIFRLKLLRPFFSRLTSSSCASTKAIRGCDKTIKLPDNDCFDALTAGNAPSRERHDDANVYDLI